MPDLTRALAVALAAGLAFPALAQDDANGDEPDASALEAPGADNDGADYIDEEFDDWQRRCFRVSDQQDPCEMYQLIEDDEGFPVAEISLVPLPLGQQVAAGATIVTPLETLLPEQIALSIDGGEAQRYPFTWCSAAGCVSRVGFTEEEVEALKAGVEVSMRIVPAAAPDQDVNLAISLIGFTAAFNSLEPGDGPQEMPTEEMPEQEAPEQDGLGLQD